MMSKEKETCEYKLLSGIYDKLNTICGEDSIKIEKTLLIKTMNKNVYLSVSTNSQFGNLFRTDSIEVVEFVGTQILKMEEKAILRLQNIEVKFYGEKLKAEIIFVDIMKWSLQFDIPSSFELPKIRDNIIMEQKELQKVSEIKKLRKKRSLWITILNLFAQWP